MIKSKRVIAALDLLVLLVLKDIACFEILNPNAGKLTVDQPVVNGEEAHEKEHVTVLAELVIPKEEQGEGGGQQNATMEDIREHQAKHEGKENLEEHGRVDLFVHRDPVGVNQGLGSFKEIDVPEAGGSERLARSNLVDLKIGI